MQNIISQKKQSIFLQSLKCDILYISLLCASTLLRMLRLGKKNLWYDEIFTLILARKSPSIWNPPLYFLVIKQWIKISGVSEFALRLPSVLFSVIAIGITYKMTKRMFDRKIAVLATVMISFSAFQIWYAQEARPYTFSLLFGTLSSYYLYKWLEDKRRRYAVYYLSSLITAIYSHYYCLLIFFFQIAYVLAVKRNRILVIKTSAVVFLALLFWLKRFIAKLAYVRRGFWIPSPTWHSLQITFANFFLGYNATSFLYTVLFFLLIILLYKLIEELFIKKHPHPAILFCIFVGILPILSVFIFSRTILPIYLDRAFLIFTPYFYALTAFLLLKLKRIYQIFFILVLLIATIKADINYYAGRMYKPSDFRYHLGVTAKKPYIPLALFIKPKLQPGTIVVTSNISITVPLFYYLHRCHTSKASIYNYVFFAFDKEAIDTNRSLRYKEERITKGTDYFIEKNELLALFRKKRIKKVIFLGCDWPRSGALDQNSQRIRSFLDNYLVLKYQKDFDGIKLFIYDTRGYIN